MSRSSGTAKKGKRAYRYAVTGAEGAGVAAIGESPHVLDWHYYGKSHTWLIFDFERGEESGSFSGDYMDRGYVVDGKYKTDAELSDGTTDGRNKRPSPKSSEPSGGGESGE